MSGQNNVPVLFDFVCIFMVPKEIEMPKLRTSRKDAFIDDSLNSLQLTRNYYIEYNLYDGQMPGNKMILVVDNSGKFTGGYEFIPSNDCTGKPYCRVVGWNANHRFTCEDYCLESNIDFIKQHKYDK